MSGEPDVAARIQVRAINRVGRDLYSASFGDPKLVTPETLHALIAEAVKQRGGKFSLQFLVSEWSDVIEPWLVRSKEDYAKVTRLGRKARIGAAQRDALWPLFQAVRDAIAARGETTISDMFDRISVAMAPAGTRPYDFAVVDEAQDLGVAEARFLAALGAGRPNALFFAGDLGQRIFQTPFSWKSLGIDIRGRSSTLRVNYRTSHQIRTRADRLLPTAISDVDGNEEGRKGTVSVFNGPPPAVRRFKSVEDESNAIGVWIAERIKEGTRPEEIGVFVRSDAEVDRARAAAKAAGASAARLSGESEAAPGMIAVSPMHLAKGLEFRAVAVMACDDEILPQQERIETVADGSELEVVYNTERHLLYVACTRARDHLIVSGVAPVSEFLVDFGSSETDSVA